MIWAGKRVGQCGDTLIIAQFLSKHAGLWAGLAAGMAVGFAGVGQCGGYFVYQSFDKTGFLLLVGKLCFHLDLEYLF